jgi:peptidoglycan/xylan/chitin deacetylase (PgdA/CDA1 family)
MNYRILDRDILQRGRRLLPLIILALLATGMMGALVCVYFSSGDSSDIFRSGLVFRKQREEAVSRLLSVPLLLYHNIDGRGEYSIDYGTMDAHFRLLRERGISVVPMDDFVKRLENPLPYDKKVAVISYDDGYPAMYTRLMPLLAVHGYHVTLFVYADNVFHAAKRNITWKQLREMQDKGFDIQSHSLGHPDLVRVIRKADAESRRRLFEEIYLSKRVLELYLAREVRYFAFPYGSYNLELVDLCRSAGYSRVFSTDYGPNIITRNNYCLRRRHIKSDYGLQAVAGLVE